MLNMLGSITHTVRDKFLLRYIARCKLINALAFFQWRCQTLEDEDAVERNKEIFYSRIEHLTKHMQAALLKKKTLAESEAKLQKANAEKKSQNPKKLMT